MNRSIPRRPASAAVAVVAALLLPAARANAPCETQVLTAAAAAALDQFGDAVAVSGSHAVVGASRVDDLGSASGAAYVFGERYDDATATWRWEQVAILRASDGAANDLFGWSVAIDGESAPPVVVVGAYYDDDGGTNSGSAYVFREEAGAWVETAKLTASDGAAGDEFGRSVAIDGNLIVVGAARDDEGATNAGSAYVFRGSGSTWAQETRLAAPTPTEQDQLGFAVALDVMPSGTAVVVAGAPLNDHAGISAGAASVFRHDAGAWAFEQTLVADDAASGDRFGSSVAVSGDLVLVGSELDDGAATNTGSAYVFRRDGEWIRTGRLVAAAAGADDRFGRAVAVRDDPTDGAVAIVGAPGHDGAADDAGAVHVFRHDGVDWIEQSVLTASDAAAGDELGGSVSLRGDLVLAGAAKRDGDPGANVGAGHVFAIGIGSLGDCDGNGVPDPCDLAAGTADDCDGNGIPDTCDIADDPGADLNGNGALDVCEDCNGNGEPDFVEIAEPDADCNANALLDACEIDAASDAPGGPFFCETDCADDCDANGVPDACDVASGAANDCNGNGVPDGCEIATGDVADCNGNGIPDACDVDPADPDGDLSVSEDCNADGVPDDCHDCNGNGLDDGCDIESGSSFDIDGNAVPDECEDCNENGLPDFVDILVDPRDDCDADDVLDVCEIDVSSDAPGGPFFCADQCEADCNVNGVIDACDIENGDSDDLDVNGVPDECEDCDANGLPDGQDIAAGALDCNANGVIDACEIPVGTGGGDFLCLVDCDPDCNANGIPDACDIDGAFSADCDGNGVPDECDDDCDGNGVPDACDVDPADPDGDGDVAQDYNDNGVPDRCDPDCDGDGLPDFLEILLGESEDEDGDGVPDDCPGVADLDGDGWVGLADLTTLLADWGFCPDAQPCPSDLNGDGRVGLADLDTMLASWGWSPAP